MSNFVTHLESTDDGSSLAADTLHTGHNGRPLLVRYDLDAVARELQKSTLATREPDLWRYRELLPLRDQGMRVSLGEGMTPLLACPRLGTKMGVPNLWIKDESQLPTGSFKARGMAMAVSVAKELGVTKVATPTAGNAGGALAAYAARAGMECFVFMPADTPRINQLEAVWHGAKAFLVDGLINECGVIVREGIEKRGWFDMSTLREPYRIEGKKTMGLELAEQMGWSLPGAIFYPTGGGTGLIGMWKAFAELEAINFLQDNAKPKMFSCQSDGCAPIAEAFDRGEDHGTTIDNPHTLASGLRVPKAIGDFLVLSAVRESGGRAMATSEDRLKDWMRLATELEGIALCPESAACLGCLDTAVQEGHIDTDAPVVVFNTGAMQKYVEVMDVTLPELRKDAVDWDKI
ncbi:MAG: threonine synthase [Planctomycetota bacterium]|nr:threonine synthase [Planctomycetota bacterium]